ncbi:hypothetical protein CRENBAI_011829 [Crenichthys baileyi]|uniref:Uncharacterized protein n=1 Tax=Crenichthys baileyi TaxID=28760 RepID=A0AAV9RRP7_9TELE
MLDGSGHVAHHSPRFCIVTTSSLSHTRHVTLLQNWFLLFAFHLNITVQSFPSLKEKGFVALGSCLLSTCSVVPLDKAFIEQEQDWSCRERSTLAQPLRQQSCPSTFKYLEVRKGGPSAMTACRRNRQEGRLLAQVCALKAKYFHLCNRIAEASSSSTLLKQDGQRP